MQYDELLTGHVLSSLQCCGMDQQQHHDESRILAHQHGAANCSAPADLLTSTGSTDSVMATDDDDDDDVGCQSRSATTRRRRSTLLGVADVLTTNYSTDTDNTAHNSSALQQEDRSVGTAADHDSTIVNERIKFDHQRTSCFSHDVVCNNVEQNAGKVNSSTLD